MPGGIPARAFARPMPPNLRPRPTADRLRNSFPHKCLRRSAAVDACRNLTPTSGRYRAFARAIIATLRVSAPLDFGPETLAHQIVKHHPAGIRLPVAPRAAGPTILYACPVTPLVTLAIKFREPDLARMYTHVATVGPPDSGQHVTIRHHPRAANGCWQDVAPRGTILDP